MSGIEVVAAVSAIISAFHGGSELLKHIKAKRRKSRQAQQEFEEKQLQDSLVSGEQQIGFRYAQDIREFGDLMRIGDASAHNQLQHITIMMQGEIIKSLQLAAQYDNAVLNLTLLHEASITNKTATFATLDQLKQRMLPKMPMNRQLQGSYESSDRRSSPNIPRTSTFDPSSFVPDTYIPLAVTIPSQQEIRSSKYGLDKAIFKRNGSFQRSLRRSKTPDDINFSQAFEHLTNARGTEDRAAIMQEIDEIVDLYQDLSTSQRSGNHWGMTRHLPGFERRQDTVGSRRVEDVYHEDPPIPPHVALQMPQILPSAPEKPVYGNYPVFNHDVFGQQKDYLSYAAPHPARNPYPQMQTQAMQPRWSRTSGTSSNYSEASSPGRNSSASSQDLPSQKPPLPLKHSSRAISSNMPYQLKPPDAQYRFHEHRNVVVQPSANPYAPTDERHESIAPLSPQNSPDPWNSPGAALPRAQTSAINTANSSPEDYNTLTYSPYATPYQHAPFHSIAPFEHPRQAPRLTYQEPNAATEDTRPKHHSSPPRSREAPHTTTEPNTTQLQSPLKSLATAPALPLTTTTITSSPFLAILPTPRPKPALRDPTLNPTTCNESSRPCKSNNYWNLCKGAWTIRASPTQGLKLHTLPLGLYNSKQIWKCGNCTFSGAVSTTTTTTTTTTMSPTSPMKPHNQTPKPTHPNKKQKQPQKPKPPTTTTILGFNTTTLIDPNTGIHYKWLFLAKSHVRAKWSDDSHPHPHPHPQHKNTNTNTNTTLFACIFCTLVLFAPSAVFQGVEALMSHISSSHGDGLSENVRRRARCVVGRDIEGKDREGDGEGEDGWDIFIPEARKA